MGNKYVAVPNVHALRQWLIERTRQDFTKALEEDEDFIEDIHVWGHTGIGNMTEGQLYMEIQERGLYDEAAAENLIANEVDFDAALELYLDTKVDEAMDDPEWHLRKLYSLMVEKWSVSAILGELETDVWQVFIREQNSTEEKP